MNFSEHEFSVLTDTDFLRTKRKIISKITECFQNLSGILESDLKGSSLNFPEKLRLTPKISKGENYRGLPYVVLDYPSYFGKESLFMFRVFFFWGYAFSTEVLLSGELLNEKKDYVLGNLEALQKAFPYISCGKIPWEYYYDDEYYKKWKDSGKADVLEIIADSGFFKIGNKLPLEHYDKLSDLVRSQFFLIMKIIF